MTAPSPEDNRFMDYLLFRSLKGDTTPSEQEKVDEWRGAASENEAYYRELERLLELTSDALDPVEDELSGAPSAADLLRQAGGGRFMGGHRPARFSRRSGWLWWLTAGLGTAAASLLVALLMPEARSAGNDLLSLGVDEFATGSSDVATVQLRDGTIVRLAPHSRLRLTGSPGEREVTLDGRAYFAVAQMEGHPFTVKTRGGEAVVLGTRFEAEARGEELRVLVVEGRVALAASGSRVDLGAGEMARAVEGAVSAAVTVPDPQRSIAWVGDFLVFQRTPVRDVAAEIRRYFGVQLEVKGQDLDSHTVTAWFTDPTAEDVIRVVCKVLAAECTTDGGTATIDLTPSPL